MGIDINLFREEKGNDPKKIKEIEEKRFKGKEAIDRVDKIVELDKAWRKTDFEFNQMNKKINSINKSIGQKMKKKENCDELIEEVKKFKDDQSELEKQKNDLKDKLECELRQVGNLLHKDVVISNDEHNNKLIRKWGELPKIKVNETPGFAHHH